MKQLRQLSLLAIIVFVIAAEQPKEIQICRVDDKPKLPCHCDPIRGIVNCKGEQLRTTNFRTVYDTTNGEQKMVVKNLDLSGNKLTRIIQSELIPLHASDIKILDLSHNSINIIENSAFNNLINLEQLDLSYNALTDLYEQTFEGLNVQLLKLDLTHNSLSDLSGPIFAKLSQLQELILDGNKISRIDDRTFSSLFYLKRLQLNHAALEHIDGDWFKSLDNLEELHLIGNELMTVPKLDRLSHLYTLRLDANPMQQINSNALKSLASLHTLTLNMMPDLTLVEECAFCGLHKLNRHEMRSNPHLSIIDSNAYGHKLYFEGKLELVDFSKNSLRTLDYGLLPWRNVTALRLYGNPWHCDCGLAWMQDKKIKLDMRLPTCETPSEHEGKPVSKTGLKSCQGGNWHLVRISRLLVFTCLLALVVGLIVLVWYLRKSYLAQRIPTPKYVYRNLAMKGEAEDAIIEGNQWTNPILDNQDQDQEQRQTLPTQL